MGLLKFISDVAWPAIVFVGVYYFRNEIRAAFGRITEFGPTGVKLDTAPTKQIATVTPTAAANDLISGIKQYLSPDQVDPSVQAIRKDLESRSSNKDEQIEMLVHTLASVNIQLAHERAYRAIFGSQIIALTRMNEAGGALEETLKTVYADAASRFSELYKNFGFDTWVEFLIKSGLATRSGENIYQTTAYGRGFLKYVLDHHLTVAKPF